jgi:hypothetical protein
MTDHAHSRILSACFRFLLPIARVLLANGIGYREFDDACKRAFVAIASSEFGVRGRETNTSRISAMTGIPRKEVQRLRQTSGAEFTQTAKMLSPLADLLHVWATAKSYRDETGIPRILQFAGEGDHSFERLVSTCMGDVPPGAVRAELVRLGAIDVTSDNKLVMLRRTLIPAEVDARLESALIYSLRGLAETIAYNNDPRINVTQRRFERFVESRPLTTNEISQIRPVLRTRLISISEEIDSMLSSGPIRNGDSDTARIGVGLYYTE